MTPLEPSDEELFELVLGELPADRAAAFEPWSRAPENQARLAEARALISTLERPQAPAVVLHGVEARLDERARLRRRTFQGASVMLVAAVACLVFFWSRIDDDGVRIKGTTPAAEKWAGIELYRLEGERPVPLVDRLSSSDSVLVAYRNGGERPFTHLLVFGVASTGALYWYYPAWQNPHDDPAAIAIEASEQLVELHERISHTLPPGRFVLHAVFARRAIRVSEVERLAAGADPSLPLPIPETAQQRRVVEVVR